MSLPHFPILRAGREYESLDRIELCSHRDGSPVASVSQANAGIIKRDLKKAAKNAAILRAIPTSQLIERCQAAAEIFMEATLPVGGEHTQTVDEYVAALSATSGLPHSLCRGNMEKCALVLREMPTILRGLLRGMDPSVIDGGRGNGIATHSVATHDGVPVWYTPNTDSLGAVLPSNSPGVHSLWLPSIALGTPVVLKPGKEEPWTPMRLVRAMMAAGIPAEAFSLYPTDHEGAGVVLESTGRALLFGDAKVAAKYAGDESIEIHGPGRSKVLFGADEAANWEEYMDVLVASVAGNGGRSCINASAIYTPSHASEIATALAERLAELAPKDHTDEAAGLAAFAKPAFADAMDSAIEAGLAKGGARDLCAEQRGTPRRAEHGGAAYLLPTVVLCDKQDHALANTEYMFPFVSVVQVPQDQMLDCIGPSLVVSAITRDQVFLDGLLSSAEIQRLNLGPLPTSKVEWDQPHEGNLFEFLYSRRALQRAQGW
ncbi:MAG: acyl-CoA reductase-like NAD-dependent aldehyde dehydrogenase [Planctomycetota bacterium]